MAKNKSTGELIAVIGGIIGLLMAILTPLGYGVTYGPSLIGHVDILILVVLQIVMSLIILATTGRIGIKALKMEKNGVVIIILGALLYIFGGFLGGIVTVLGGIIMLL
ncbi:MAG: hypothetical protein QXS20_05370 [Candidatus Thorarchaeota archaeon]